MAMDYCFSCNQYKDIDFESSPKWFGGEFKLICTHCQSLMSITGEFDVASGRFYMC